MNNTLKYVLLAIAIAIFTAVFGKWVDTMKNNGLANYNTNGSIN